jgi:hypothetical protein
MVTSVTEGRTLLIFEVLPKREKFLDAEQAEKDIREAMAKAEAKLRDRAQHWHIMGWTEVGDIDYSHPSKGVIAAKQRMER